MENKKYFPDINEAKTKVKEIHKNIPNEVKEELLNELPARLQRNIDRGNLYLNHYLSMISTQKLAGYVKAVQEVCRILKEEGYTVRAFVEDYNSVYKSITIQITWDIKAITEDDIINAEYNSRKRDICKEIQF